MVNVHIRFEQQQNHEHPFNIGAHIAELKIQTCDAKGKTFEENKFYDHDPDIVRRKLLVKGLGVYCNAR